MDGKIKKILNVVVVVCVVIWLLNIFGVIGGVHTIHRAASPLRSARVCWRNINRPMKLTLKPHHLKRYKDIAMLFLEIWHAGLGLRICR